MKITTPNFAPDSGLAQDTEQAKTISFAIDRGGTFTDVYAQFGVGKTPL